MLARQSEELVPGVAVAVYPFEPDTGAVVIDMAAYVEADLQSALTLAATVMAAARDTR
jgi:hypothetical protein